MGYQTLKHSSDWHGLHKKNLPLSLITPCHTMYIFWMSCVCNIPFTALEVTSLTWCFYIFFFSCLVFFFCLVCSYLSHSAVDLLPCISGCHHPCLFCCFWSQKDTLASCYRVGISLSFHICKLFRPLFPNLWPFDTLWKALGCPT